MLQNEQQPLLAKQNKLEEIRIDVGGSSLSSPSSSSSSESGATTPTNHYGFFTEQRPRINYCGVTIGLIIVGLIAENLDYHIVGGGCIAGAIIMALLGCCTSDVEEEVEIRVGATGSRPLLF